MRRGFTLTELLVVITITIILLAVTAGAVNFTLSAERIRSGARQVQSYLEGARDRAIYSKKPVGVRFIVDQTDTRTSTSMIFIGNEGEPYNIGTIRMGRWDTDNDMVYTGEPIQIVYGYPHPLITPSSSFVPTNWHLLVQKGLLANGSQIILSNSSGPIGGNPYTINLGASTLTATTQELHLTAAIADPGPPDTTDTSAFPYPLGGGPNAYSMAMPPTVLPNQEPMLLPRGIVIDLDASRVPANWRPTGAGGYSNRMDVIFSPRGYVIGNTAASGLIHLYVAEAPDVIFASSLPGRPVMSGANPVVPAAMVGAQNIGDRVLVTLFTQTGNVSCHPVNPTDANSNDIADDPYAYAEVGEVAGQ